MVDQSSPDVFVSYSRHNKDVMQRAVAFMRNKGFKVWVDNERLTPGTPIWEAEIEGAIAAAGTTVVLLSPEAKQSEWVRAEVEYSKKNNKRVFPVLVAGDVRTSVPLGLLSHQFADLRTDEKQGLEELAEALTAYLGNPSRSQELPGQEVSNPEFDQDAVAGSETPPKPRDYPHEEIGTAQYAERQGQNEGAREGVSRQDNQEAGFPSEAEAPQRGGNRKIILGISGVIGICVIGACVVGAVMLIPRLRPPLSPAPTEPPQVTDVPTAPPATQMPTDAPTEAPTAAGATEAPTLSAQDIISSNISSDWPMENHDPARTSYNPTESYLQPPLRELWVKNLGSDYAADGVSVSNGRVAVDGEGPNSTNEIYMLDAATGDDLWSFTLTGGGAGSMSSTPAFGGNNVFFGGQSDTNLYALDVNTGQVSWERSGISTLYSSEIGVVGDTLYVPDSAKGVAAFQSTSGSPLWYDGIGGADLPAAIGSNMVFGVLPDSTTLVALDRSSGSQVWSLSDVNSSFTWIVSDSNRLYANLPGNEIVSLNANDGTELWKTTLDIKESGFQGAALMDNKLFIPVWKDNQGNGGVIAVDANTGQVVWNFATGSEGVISVAAANGVLYTAGWSSSTLYALSPSDGSVIWSYPLGCNGGQLAIAHGILFVTSCSQIYALTNQN